MKAKSKKKTVLWCCIFFILLLLLAAVYFFQFTGLGYRMSVPYRSSFEKAADHIYVNKNYSGDVKEVIQLTEDALERDRAFFGRLQCTDTAKTIVIFCDDDNLLSKLGGDHDTKTSMFDPKRNCISVSDEYLNVDIIAHELTHAEMHTRLNTKALKGIPTWFDEGLATQNDYREQYGPEAWAEQTENGKKALPLEEMDTPSEFYAGEAEDRRFRYLNAKHEVSVWMNIHQQKGLLELFDRLNKGEAFDAAYAK